MPAQAGIQSAVEFNNFKDLDSRFRGNDAVFPNFDTASRGGKVRVGGMIRKSPQKL
jgi:hypothetical protein